jgi:hypothetical protein
MSLRSALATPSSLQSYIRSTCLVPFLYHTPTLSSQPLQAQSCKKGRSSGTAPRSFSSQSQRKYEISDYGTNRPRPEHVYYKANPSPNRRFNRPSDCELPFEDVDCRDKAESLQKNEQSRKSTITPSENAVWECIIQDIEKDERKQRIDKDDALEDELDDGHDPQEDLNAIFDAAIREIRMQEEKATLGAEKSSQRVAIVGRERAVDVLASRKDEPAGAVVFRRPLKLANGIVLGDEMQTEESLERLKQACDDHKGLISGMLEQATTDLEIWQVLKKEVFKLVDDLNAQIAAREKALEEQDRKAEAAETEDKPKKENKIRPKNRPKVKKSTQETIALPTDTLYSILSTNYSDYLLSALRLLRRHHPTSSYALSLLPTMKRLGPISYVLGASTGLYNEILFLRWTQYSDLHGMADLLLEMLGQGIEVNGVTNMLLGKLRMNRRAGLKGRMGPVVTRWWDLRGTDEGWKRIVGLEQVIKREEVEAIARRAGEKEEEREEQREEYERLKKTLMVE